MKFPLVLAASSTVLITVNSCWSFSFSAINCNKTDVLTLTCTDHKTFWNDWWACKKINMELQTQHAHITSEKCLPIQCIKNGGNCDQRVYEKLHFSIHNYLWFSHIHSKQIMILKQHIMTLTLKNKYNPDLHCISQAVTVLSCVWKAPSLNTSMNTDKTYWNFL